jgi:threonine dehydrogenase-like Zn-dependent dehydrogenase
MSAVMTRLSRFDAGSLITHTVRFDDAPTAYDLIDTHPGETLGILLDYTADSAS